MVVTTLIWRRGTLNWRWPAANKSSFSVSPNLPNLFYMTHKFYFRRPIPMDSMSSLPPSVSWSRVWCCTSLWFSTEVRFCQIHKQNLRNIYVSILMAEWISACSIAFIKNGTVIFLCVSHREFEATSASLTCLIVYFIYHL